MNFKNCLIVFYILINHTKCTVDIRFVPRGSQAEGLLEQRAIHISVLDARMDAGEAYTALSLAYRYAYIYAMQHACI